MHNLKSLLNSVRIGCNPLTAQVCTRVDILVNRCLLDWTHTYAPGMQYARSVTCLIASSLDILPLGWSWVYRCQIQFCLLSYSLAVNNPFCVLFSSTNLITFPLVCQASFFLSFGLWLLSLVMSCMGVDPWVDRGIFSLTLCSGGMPCVLFPLHFRGYTFLY